MRRIAPIGLTLLLSVLLAAPAVAAPGAQVPAFTLKLIQANTGDAAYLPTRLPLGYAYERWRLSGGELVVTFEHKRSADRFTFQVRRLQQGME